MSFLLRRYWHILILCLLGLTSTGPVRGQDFTILHYSTETGLPANIVYSLLRDHAGYLWFGTDKGISRYNGIRFETLTTFDGLPDNEILFIQEDRYGRLWICTYTGGVCYYENGVFHTAKNTPMLEWAAKLQGIPRLAVEQDGSMTIAFPELGTFMNVDGMHCQRFSPPAVAGDSVSFIHVRKLGVNQYELIRNGQRIRIDSNYRRLVVTPLSVEGPLSYVRSERTGYLSAPTGIYTLEGRPLLALTAVDSPKWTAIKNLYYDQHNTFAGTHDQGLVINGIQHILQDCKITGVTQDPAGNYWVSTLTNGVYTFGKDFLQTKTIKNVYEGDIKFAFTDEGTLFFTTANNNLYRYQDGVVSNLFDYSRYRGKQFKIIMEPGFLEENGEYHSFYGKDHFILDQLHAVHPRIRRNKILTDEADVRNSDVKTEGSSIKSIFFSPRRISLMQTGHKIIFIDRARALAGGETYFEGSDINQGNDRIISMAEDASDAIWYSTRKSIFKISNGKAVQQRQFAGMTFKRFYISGSYLIGITHDNKLIICNNINGQMRADTVLDHDCIWNRGYRLDPSHMLFSSNKQYRIVTLRPSPDTPAYDIAAVEDPYIPTQAEYITADGEQCYFFKGGAVTAVGIAGLLQRPAPPAPVFTYIKTTDSIYNTLPGRMLIPYEERRNISIGFSALSLSSKDVRYEYSISRDEHDDWQLVKGEEINLLSPGYGDYQIKIRGKSLSSDYSVPAVLLLSIAKPFWASWWFITAVAAVVISLVWVGVRYRIRYLIRKRERAHATEIKFMRSEYKALNALMNPHFIFNSLNNIQGLINEDNKRAANEYLRIFSNLIRQNMHNISKELIPLQKEIDLVSNYLKLEKLRFSEWLNYSIEIDEQVELDTVMVPPLLVQPLVENGIKHGLMPRRSPDNHVGIHVYEQGDYVYIAVRDNGIGIRQSRKNANSRHTSFALDNIEKRLTQLRLLHDQHVSLELEEITDDRGAVQGTLATIKIRLSASQVFSSIDGGDIPAS
ncbi:histidine kinase [Chitinophaga sp. MD30]|uniref:sensor histidine kinase n=1 Tax=Chitinophaga sp. MD30 TaxID=2033437 RepID=UPI000BAF36CF|nr:histidine kinase [Chitinophaga sp. MD30]ASZ11231.1 hypothetical protein CK934_09770 [Chitinophaga sp. MD30]